MIRKVSLAWLAILAAACSGGGSNSSGDLSDMPPIGDIPLPSQGRFNAFVSWAAQRDLRPFREAYGYGAPGSSSNEVLENQNLPPFEPAFYAFPETGHCASLTHAELPIDGVSTWP